MDRWIDGQMDRWIDGFGLVLRGFAYPVLSRGWLQGCQSLVVCEWVVSWDAPMDTGGCEYHRIF